MKRQRPTQTLICYSFGSTSINRWLSPSNSSREITVTVQTSRIWYFSGLIFYPVAALFRKLTEENCSLRSANNIPHFAFSSLLQQHTWHLCHTWVRHHQSGNHVGRNQQRSWPNARKVLASNYTANMSVLQQGCFQSGLLVCLSACQQDCGRTLACFSWNLLKRCSMMNR